MRTWPFSSNRLGTSWELSKFLLFLVLILFSEEFERVWTLDDFVCRVFVPPTPSPKIDIADKRREHPVPCFSGFGSSHWRAVGQRLWGEQIWLSTHEIVCTRHPIGTSSSIGGMSSCVRLDGPLPLWWFSALSHRIVFTSFRFFSRSTVERRKGRCVRSESWKTRRNWGPLLKLSRCR